MTTPTAQLAMAKRMINASIAAYQIHPAGWVPGPPPQPPAPPLPAVTRTIQGPGGAYFYDVVAAYQDAVGFVGTAAGGYSPLFTASGEDDIDAALVGAMADGNLLIALRGTLPPNIDNDDWCAWIHDWTIDAEIQPRDWSVRRGVWNSSCKVQTGFAADMLSLWPGIAALVRQVLATTPCTGVVITGHSKGGALCFLAATLVEAIFPQFAGQIQVHAFAAPPVGNAVFAQTYGALAATTHRYQVQNDIVPFVPLWSGADIFTAAQMPDWELEAGWVLLGGYVYDQTAGGYTAVGDFTYFDCNHLIVPGADVTTSALPDVAATLKAGDFSTIAAAHGAVASYLPCFP